VLAVVGDVSGKGIPAALFIGSDDDADPFCRPAVRLSPTRLFAMQYRRVRTNSQRACSYTLFCGIIDLAKDDDLLCQQPANPIAGPAAS